MNISIIYNISEKLPNLSQSLWMLHNIDKTNIEIIFIVQKKSEELLKSIEGISFKNASKKIYLTSSNQGEAYGFNMGIGESSHEYIMLATPNTLFSDDFLDIINNLEIQKFDVAFFSGLKNGNEKTFKESFKHKSVSIWNTIFSKLILKNNNIFIQNYTKIFFEFIYDLIKYSKNIIIRESKISTFNLVDNDSYNSYDILVDATKIIHKLESLDSKEDKEYFKALVSIMIIYEFLHKIKNNNAEGLKIAIKNVNILINNIYPDYKNNTFLLQWQKEEVPKFVINFIPTLKYCLKGL